MMIDLHTHTLLSDGELLPSEMVRRAEVAGYEAIGLTDHVDASNIDFALPRLVTVCRKINAHWKIVALPGVEITHAPLEEIGALVKYARKNGARVVIVHGETVSEPVIPGTNRAGIEAGADIIAHPGYIKEADAALAAKRGVLLELTARKSHSSSNAHVARAALRAGCGLILNTDAHSHKDFINDATAARLLSHLGIRGADRIAMFKAARKFLPAHRRP